jgi:hypothetical protein
MDERAALKTLGFTDAQIDAAKAARAANPPPAAPFYWANDNGTVTRYEHGAPPVALSDADVVALIGPPA